MDETNYKNRLQIADLIFAVLTDKLSVQKALSLFPSDKDDINIKCAFDALMHREADEDLRAKIKDYALVQDKYLSNIAEFLKKNKELPVNIINRYQDFHKSNILPDNETGLKNIFKKLKRMINF